MPGSFVIPYAPRFGSEVGRIGDLMRRQGDIAAERAARSGEIWGGTLRDIAQGIAQIPRLKLEQQREEGARKLEQERAARERQQGELYAARAAKETAALDTRAKQDAEFQQLFSGPSLPGPQDLMAVDPERGLAMAKGLSALSGFGQQKPEDALKQLPVVARAFQATPDSLKPGAWQTIRHAVVSAGLARPEGLPEQFSPELMPMIDKYAALGEKEERPETRSIEAQLADPNITSERRQQLLQAKRDAAMAGHVADPGSAIVRVDYRDPVTGKNVSRYMPKAAAAQLGQVERPLTGTQQLRGEMASTVVSVGDQLIQKLSDPKYAAQIGPAMGRFNTLREFIGNPPPEYAELAGEIESFSLANMGVHGMRSVVGAEKIKELLDKKQTPQSLAAAIKGLLAFSREFGQTQAPMKPRVLIEEVK